jgi:hypothetical protein
MGFWDPSTLAALGSDLHRVCLTRLCCAFRLSQPLDALFLPVPSGFVSRRWRPWVFRPPEVCSSLAADPTFRRACPSWCCPDECARQGHPGDIDRSPGPGHAGPGFAERVLGRPSLPSRRMERPKTPPPSIWPPEPGLTFRGLSHGEVRASIRRVLPRTDGADPLMGFHLPRVFSLPATAAPSCVASSHALCVGFAEAARAPVPQSISEQEDWLVSREIADPSEISVLVFASPNDPEAAAVAKCRTR